MPHPMDPKTTAHIYGAMWQRLRNGPQPWTIQQIGKFTGYSDKAVSMHLSVLLDQGRIIHTGFFARARIFALPGKEIDRRISCLKCRGLFLSGGAGHRICDRCKLLRRHDSGGLDEVRYPSTGRIKSPHSGAL